MKFSYTWLKQLTQTRKSPEKIAELLTTHSFEVESIEKQGSAFDNVVVGEVVDMHQHPNADRLNVTRVVVAPSGKAKAAQELSTKNLQIVCGAPNVRTGQKVAVALVGAVLPNGMEITPVKLRGVESMGMICSEKELGLGSDHEGIMVLPSDAKVGTPLAQYLCMDDTVLDIDVLPNRGHDALGHVGMARDIAAIEGKELPYDTQERKLPKKKAKDLTVKIAKGAPCSRYIGTVIDGIQVGPSPQWLKARLEACGIQSINNVVDCTNYVMLELGQPLHAFDFFRLTTNDQRPTTGILVRKAKAGESIELLDGSQKELHPEDLVIATKQKVLALAGVMGGQDSGVSDGTTRIVLEAAAFDAATIRRTRSRHGLQTDAAYRFERDLDPNLCTQATVRAIELITEVAGGEILGVQDVYPEKVRPGKVTLEGASIAALLGAEIPQKDAMRILTLLGCTVAQKKQKKAPEGAYTLMVTIPTVRRDLTTSEDLIEEVGRIWGYDQIVPTPLHAAVQTPPENTQRHFERQVRSSLVAQGFTDTRHYSFYSAADAQALGIPATAHLTLQNPMNPEQQYMRASLLPGILHAAAGNLRYQTSVQLCELGRVYIPQKLQTLPEERRMLAAAVVMDGASGAEHFYALKGAVEQLLAQLGIVDVTFDAVDEEFEEHYWHPSRTAHIKTADGKTLGTLGEIAAPAAKHFGMKKKRVAVCELDMATLQMEASALTDYAPLRKFPTILRDLSMRVPERTRIADVDRTIAATGGDLVIDVDLFDVYEDPETGERSMAFHITFGADDRTLEGKEVDARIAKVIATLEEELDVMVRREG